MKTNFKSVRRILSIFLTALLLTSTSCSKDPVTPPIEEIGEPINPGDGKIEQGEGIDIDEVENDNGSIGIMINTRAIARKGYRPSSLDIAVTATTGNFSKTDIVLDEYTNVAKHSFKVDDLTDAEETELREGVDIVIVVKDANGGVLETKTISKTSFIPSPAEIAMEGDDLEDNNPPIALREGVPYYIQDFGNDNENILGGIYNRSYNRIERAQPAGVVWKEQIDYDNDTSTLFYFEPIAGKPGVYAIAHYVGDAKFYLYVSTGDLLYIQTIENRRLNGGNTDPSDLLNYQFKIERNGVDKFTIVSQRTGKPLNKRIQERGLSFGAGDLPSQDNHYVVNFRILSFDIDWDIQSLDTRYEEPILPANNTESAVNSTLKNCSSGALTQTVGKSESKESVSTTTWEESMSLSSRFTIGVSVTASAEVNTVFYGMPTKVGLSVTGSFEASSETTQTKTISEGSSTSESVTISTERTITVPSKKATRVTDLYQTYENVQIPYVQRFRIRGIYTGDNTGSLTGEEIISQFHFNGFSGVITETGADYIEVTVKGTTKVDQLIDTRTY